MNIFPLGVVDQSKNIYHLRMNKENKTNSHTVDNYFHIKNKFEEVSSNLRIWTMETAETCYSFSNDKDGIVLARIKPNKTNI